MVAALERWQLPVVKRSLAHFYPYGRWRKWVLNETRSLGALLEFQSGEPRSICSPSFFSHVQPRDALFFVGRLLLVAIGAWYFHAAATSLTLESGQWVACVNCSIRNDGQLPSSGNESWYTTIRSCRTESGMTHALGVSLFVIRPRVYVKLLCRALVSLMCEDTRYFKAPFSLWKWRGCRHSACHRFVSASLRLTRGRIFLYIIILNGAHASDAAAAVAIFPLRHIFTLVGCRRRHLWSRRRFSLSEAAAWALWWNDALSWQRVWF